MRIIKSVVTLCILFLISESQGIEKRDLSYSDTVRGEAQLQVSVQKIKIGQDFQIRLEYLNTGTGTFLFNPFFNRLLPCPGEILVLDSDQKIAGKIPFLEAGSQKEVTSDDWVFVHGNGSIVGTTFDLVGGVVKDPSHLTHSIKLNAAQYYIQAVYFNSFLGINVLEGKKVGPHDGDLILKNFDRTILFTSNLVKIDLQD